MKTLFLFLCFFTFQAQAQRQVPMEVQRQVKSLFEITVEKETSLYALPTVESKILRILQVGEVITATISEKKYFLEVLDKPNGSRLGYIHTAKIKGFRIKRLAMPSPSSQTTPYRELGYRQSYGLGLRYLRVHMKQQAYSDTINEVTYEFSEFESQGASYGLQLSLPSVNNWNFRINLVQRTTSFRAQSKIKGVPNSYSHITRNQKLLGVGLDINHYLTRRSYIISGVEISKGTDVDIQFGAQTLATGKNDLPFFVLAKLGIGYDFEVFKNLYLNPEVEIGLDLNSDPLAHYLSFSVGANFAF